MSDLVAVGLAFLLGCLFMVGLATAMEVWGKR